jgi:hypothetical protein
MGFDPDLGSRLPVCAGTIPNLLCNLLNLVFFAVKQKVDYNSGCSHPESYFTAQIWLNSQEKNAIQRI